MKVQCPICQKILEWEVTPTRPFCSERCRLIDLGQWAEGKYAVPDDHTPVEENDSDAPEASSAAVPGKP